MPIACEGNPFKIDGEDPTYIELVGELWGAFCGGMSGFELEEEVVARAQTMFHATSLANFNAGRFDEPGVKEQALRCCRATGAIGRALAEMREDASLSQEDFETAGRLVQRLTAGDGAVC